VHAWGVGAPFRRTRSHARTQHARTGESGRLRQFTALQSQAAAAAPTTRNRQAMASGLLGFTALFVCLFGALGPVVLDGLDWWSQCALGTGQRQAAEAREETGDTRGRWTRDKGKPAHYGRLCSLLLPNLYYKTGSTYLHNEPVSLEDFDC
jgi:hypothetical protein